LFDNIFIFVLIIVEKYFIKVIYKKVIFINFNKR